MDRRRLQFSIRALLLIVAIVSVPLFWMAKISDRTRRQEAAIQEVAKHEGIVGQSGGNVWVPEWFRVAVGEEFFRSPRTVDFATNLGRRFGSNEAKATDEDLAVLESLTEVETLELGNNEGITDRGLIHLKPLENLSTLYLYQTGVQGPGLVHLERLPKLHSISLSRSELGDSGLKHLGNMPHLKWAALDQTHITDAGMADLAKATGLESLSLRRTAVSDVGLRQLEGLRRLELLDLTGTRVTAEGVAHLKQALPHCQVSVTFGLGMPASEELLFSRRLSAHCRRGEC